MPAVLIFAQTFTSIAVVVVLWRQRFADRTLGASASRR
jgi:hypothetical protein